MYPYQYISKPQKYIPSNPSNPVNKQLPPLKLPYKPMLNLNHVISVINNKKNTLYELSFIFLFFNRQSVRFKTVYYCTSLNASTRRHRCGNETKSDSLVQFSSTEICVSLCNLTDGDFRK